MWPYFNIPMEGHMTVFTCMPNFVKYIMQEIKSLYLYYLLLHLI